jgi:glycine oxidase
MNDLVGSSRDVVVVGAGVIGTTVAHRLVEAGLRVAVLDDHPIGSGCTFHGTGQVWKMVWNETAQYRLGMEATKPVLELAAVVAEDTGIDTGLHGFDTLIPIFDESDRIRVDRDVSTSAGEIELEWLDHKQVLELEPRLNPEVQTGALMKGGFQIDAYRLTQAVARVAMAKGAEFLPLRAIGVVKHGDRVVAVQHTGGSIACGAVVIAMGAWSGAATDWLGFPIPIKPLKGETIRVRPTEPLSLAIWRPSGGTAFPRKDGSVSIGATGTNRFRDLSESTVKLDYDHEPTLEGAAELVSKACYVIPQLRQAEVVYHLAGPRPLSMDGMPIIGPVPGLSGAYVASGHRNKGLHLSALTATIIRDFVTQNKATTETDLTRFLPDRFTNRQSLEIDVAGVTG